MNHWLALLMLSTATASGVPEIYGDWVVTAPLASAPDTPLSGSEIESIVGTSVSYQAKSVAFGREQCERPLFDSYTQTNDNLHALFQIYFDDLKIPGEETLAIDINCMEPDVDFIAGNTVLLAGRDRLVAVVDGVWFELQRRKP